MSFLEIAWTSFIGMALIGVIVGFHIVMSNSSQKMTADIIAQENMTEFTKLVSNDFNKVGYRDSTGSPVLVAQSDTLTFLSDIDNNTSIDTVKYIKGSTAERTRTQNPNDFLVYRIKLPSDTIKLNAGFTEFVFTYFDSAGAATLNPALVRGFSLSTKVENRYPNPDGTYSGVAWSNTFYPRNLNTR